VLHAVSGVIVSDDVLVGVVILPTMDIFFISNPDFCSSLIASSAAEWVV